MEAAISQEQEDVVLDPRNVVCVPLMVATLLDIAADRSFSLLSFIGSLVDWALQLV
jgi:hypothetical protein